MRQVQSSPAVARARCEIFKGSGFYATDYRGDSGRRSAKKDSKDSSSASASSTTDEPRNPPGDAPARAVHPSPKRRISRIRSSRFFLRRRWTTGPHYVMRAACPIEDLGMPQRLGGTGKHRHFPVR